MPIADLSLPTPSPGGTNFSTILLNIRQTLSDRCNVVLDYVMLGADRPRVFKHSQMDKVLRVRPLRRTSPYPNNDPGAGRLGDLKVRNIAVDCYARSSSDVTGNDLVALTNETYGLLKLEDLVLNALDQHTPYYTDDADNKIPLVVEPMRETYTDDPNRPQPIDGFLDSTIYFELTYIPLYNTSYE